MKQLQNTFTTPEQSKRLLELGVPANSADCYHDNWRNSIHVVCDNVISDYLKRQCPCWSVGRLMEIFDICCEDRLVDDWKQFDEISPFNYINYIIVRFEDNIMNFSKLEE